MDTEEFGKLYRKLVESYQIDPKIAETLLHRIIKVLTEKTDRQDEVK